MSKYSLKKIFLNEFSSLSTAAVETGNVPPDEWNSGDADRIDKKKIIKNKKFIDQLGLTGVANKNINRDIYINHTDPQYKRQISIFSNPNNVIKHKEPVYLPGTGEHRISELGYSKISKEKRKLGLDIYLAPYDPNWKRSKEMVNISISDEYDKQARSYNITQNMFLDEPQDKMWSSLKKEWNELKKSLYENNTTFYHGTNLSFKPGDIIKPPIETDNISEKGRKKNLDKVFFTADLGSAKIYAGRAKASLGSGMAHIYEVEPIGEIEWINKKPGTTVVMAPKAKVIKKII